jgi:hypothetical protein
MRPKSTIRGYVRRTLRVGVVLLAAVAIAANAWAIVITGGETGLFGVTAGQTIRVSVVNASDKGGIVPCVGVFDLSGNRLAEVDAMPLRPGEGTFVDFNAAAFGLREGQRMQVRVAVELEGQGPADDGSPPPDPDDNRSARASDAILTLEIFDTDTGETAFTMPWVLAGFNPQPEPPKGR